MEYSKNIFEGIFSDTTSSKPYIGEDLKLLINEEKKQILLKKY